MESFDCITTIKDPANFFDFRTHKLHKAKAKAHKVNTPEPIKQLNAKKSAARGCLKNGIHFLMKSDWKHIAKCLKKPKDTSTQSQIRTH